jgi:DNA modification methylase
MSYMSPRIPPQRASRKDPGIAPDRAPNVLHYGDCLNVLRDRIPSESVDLIYLDPPFNSQRAYNMIFKEHDGAAPTAQIRAFGDTWEWNEQASNTLDSLCRSAQTPKRLRALLEGLDGAIHQTDMMAYVAMMAARIVELNRVLKPTGSLYLHCDPTASHYLKMLLDAVLGPDSFRSEIVWKRSGAHSDTKQGRKLHGHIHDVILFYTKGREWTWNDIFTPYGDSYVGRDYRLVDEAGRRFRRDNLTAAKPGGNTSYAWRVKKHRDVRERWVADLDDEHKAPKPDWEYKSVPPYKGRYWAYSIENMKQFAREGRLRHTFDGMPEYKRFLDEMPGIPLQDLWTDISPIIAGAAERLGYPTQKPVALLERIIRSSSNEGDVVLDPFCGCGTAVDAAERLGRKWIGIDVTHLAIGVIEQRMKVRHPGVLYDVRGQPVDVASAVMLAADDKFGFQAWAVLKVSARPMGLDEAGRARRGADQGLDGMLSFAQDAAGKDVRNMIVSVKGGGTSAADVRDLLGVVTTKSNKAVMGVLITAGEPSKPMRDAALDAGKWYSETWGKEYPRIQLLSVADLFKGKLPDHPGRNVTFAIADTAEKDEEQIVIPGLGIDGLSPEMAKRQQRRRPKKAQKVETAEIAFPEKKTSASRLARRGRSKSRAA